MLFDQLFTSVYAGGMSPGMFVLCTVLSLVMGLAVAGIYRFRNKDAGSGFVMTLALLPAIVQTVILLVNGNLGTGIAVMGAFSLIRFRSAPGSAREIGSIFFAMAIGLAMGMGHIGYAVICLLLIGAAMLLMALAKLGEPSGQERDLRVTIPENLDYEGVFDDLFEQYTNGAELTRVKTTNLGSLYELTYRISLKGDVVPKAFMDDMRCRNGNLNIVCARPATGKEVL